VKTNLMHGNDIEVLTGYQQPKKQAQWFIDNGIRYVIDANGKVVTTNEWLNGWDKYHAIASEDDGFNLGGLRNAS